MIVQFFNTGSGKAESAINYLMGKDSNGNDRDPPPEIFSGDIDLTKHLINSNKRQNKYTSGVISFADNEQLTEKQLKEILKAFRDTFCPGMGEDRVNMLVVKHREKGNTELHFIVPKVEMKTNKAFNIAPPGNSHNALVRDFQAITNDFYGFKQVVENPFKAGLSSLDNKLPQKRGHKKVAESISKTYGDLILKGAINNRDELINDLSTNLGDKFKSITKQKYGVTFTFKNGESIRCKGKMFREDSNYSAMRKQHKESIETISKPNRDKAFSRLMEGRARRLEFNKKAFIDYKPKKRTYNRSTIYKPSSKIRAEKYNFKNSCKSALSKLDSLENFNKSAISNNQPTKKISESFSGKLEKLTNKLKEQCNSSSNQSRPSTKNGSNTSLASVEASIQSAISELANAQTTEEKFRIYFKLAELMEQRRKMYLEMAEQENSQSNSNPMVMKPRPR